MLLIVIRGAYYLHGKPGNSGWEMKWYIPFHLRHFRNYIAMDLINAFFLFLLNFPIDSNTFSDLPILHLEKLQH